MRAKVKTTVIDTGQEYLLLVSKMNLKGILVNTSQMLKPNTQLMLELKLNEQDPIMLKGYVHKISEESSSKKGMVIAFANPSEEAKSKIQRFIDDSKEISAEGLAAPAKPAAPAPAPEKKKSKWTLRKKKEPDEEKPVESTKKSKKKDDEPFEPNKTMIVGDEDLPSMSLSSPDNKSALKVATMDEESLHAKNPGLAGSTRHVKIDPRNPVKKSVEKKAFRLSTIYKAFGFVLTVIILVLAAKPVMQIMDTKFGKKFVLPGTTPQPTNNTNNQPAQTSNQSATTQQPAAANGGSLDSIQVEDQGGFMKITLLGKGNFGNNTFSKLTGPNRIHIELAEVIETTAPASKAVNNNPISKINVTKDKAVAVDILYTGATPPNYEAKVFNGGLDIYIYR